MTARTPPFTGRHALARVRPPRLRQTGPQGNPWGAAAAEDTPPLIAQQAAPAWLQAKRRQAVIKQPGMSLALLTVLAASITFLTGDNNRDFDSQVALHFAGYGLAALSIVYALGQRKLLLNLPIGLWAILPMFLALTAVYAPQPTYAIAVGLANLIVLLFCWRLVNRLGPERSVFMLVIAGGIIALLSIIVFYAVPDLGQTSANWLTGEVSGRMRGVSSAANNLGSVSAFTMLIAFIYFRRFDLRQRIYAGLAAALALFALIGSDSRTSILGLLLCAGLWWLCRGGAARRIVSAVALGLAVCVALALNPNWISILSRSSRSDDLATFNGRSEVWAVAWENITRYPYLGQGFGSSHLILQNDDRLFAAAIHTHNLFLELLFSGGVVALGVFLLAFAMTVLRCIKRTRVEPLIVLMFFLILGAMEATPFAGFPAFQAFGFYTAVALCLAGRAKLRRQQAAYPWASALQPRLAAAS